MKPHNDTTPPTPKDNGNNPEMPLYLWITGGVAAAICGALSLSGPGNVRCAPALNPFYTETVNYPPGHSFKAVLAAFLITGFFYLLSDYFVIRKKAGFSRFLWNAVFIATIILAMEMAAGLFTRLHPPLHRPHPAYLWELYPSHHGRTMVGDSIRRLDVNRWGFRGSEIKRKKEPGTVRIMILGDSAAFGYGVEQEEVFSRVLEKELEKLRPQEKFQVINGAVCGYTTFSSSRMFTEKGVHFQPDIVIIAHNNDSDPDWDTDSNRAPRGWQLNILKILYKSDLYLMIRKEVLNRKTKDEEKIRHRPPKENAVARVTPEELESNMEAVFNASSPLGAVVLVVSMPRMEDEDYTILKYRSIMKNTALKRGGRFIDLLGLWNSDPASEKLFLDDVHPDGAGHRLIAEQLAPVISGILENNRNGKRQ